MADSGTAGDNALIIGRTTVGRQCAGLIGPSTLDGYRSVGPDFPGMGVHWLRISTLIGGELDPDRPALLCYIEIDGNPTLVNIAYGMALRPGQEPPAVNVLPPDPWHEHHGTAEEEMIRPHGHGDIGKGG